ncbi:MAG: AraC family transcriptional regulator [Paludibacter sp.]|nr:AraC family transcriptional regulator [Paludibacter sp.]
MTMNYNDLGVEFKYLIVSEKDKKFGLSVNTVGFQSIQPNSPYPITDHPSGYFFNTQKGRILHEYQFVYITKGKGTLRFDSGEEIPISKGILFVIFPGQWHTYQPLTESGWNEYYIGFEGSVFDSIVEKSFISRENQILEVGINEELVNLFTCAIEVAESDKICSQQYLSGIVLHILGLALSVSQNKIFEVGDVVQKIEQAKIIMNENVYKNIDPEELANKLSISYSWFRKVFKDYTGYAPAKYFQELKLRKAKHLLVSTSHSVKVISYMLDYNSTEHFFSLFKKITGFTPLEYRSYGRGSQAEIEEPETDI